MPRALVTGATGLVGSYIVERLLADGWSVGALVRDPATAAWLGALGVALYRGDTLDAASLERAARGSDTIFHAAAAITPRGGWESFRATNLDGTQNAIRAAAATGARLLHLSSVAVYGPTARYQSSGAATDEHVPLAPLPEGAHYARSKRESEAMVLEAHARGEIWSTAVRPCVVYGRRDRQFVPRAARLFDIGFTPIIGDGRSTLSIVHAANVADGAVRAAASPATGGKAYNVANDFDLTVADFVRLAGEGLGHPVRRIPVPLPVARAAMTLVRGVVGLVAGRGMASMSGATLDFLTRDNPFSSDLARREFGWSPMMRPEEGVPDAFRWWKEAEL